MRAAGHMTSPRRPNNSFAAGAATTDGTSSSPIVLTTTASANPRCYHGSPWRHHRLPHRPSRPPSRLRSRRRRALTSPLHPGHQMCPRAPSPSLSCGDASHSQLSSPSFMWNTLQALPPPQRGQGFLVRARNEKVRLAPARYSSPPRSWHSHSPSNLPMALCTNPTPLEKEEGARGAFSSVSPHREQ